MLKELLQAKNLSDILKNQVNRIELKRGIYIFLENKQYNLSDIDDHFLANHVSVVCKKSIPNEVFNHNIRRLGLYGYAFSANKQILSNAGLNTIYSKMYTINNWGNFLNSEKEIQRVAKFYRQGFTREYVEGRMRKMLGVSVTKEERSAAKKATNQLVAQLIKKHEKIIDSLQSQAKDTFQTVQANKDVIDEIIFRYEQADEGKLKTELKTLRLNVIVNNDFKMPDLEEQCQLYLTTSLLAHKNIYYKNQLYFHSAISANYNKDKSYMYANRLDAQTVGNELLKEDELEKNNELYLFLKALSQEKKGLPVTFYLKDKMIKFHPEQGDIAYHLETDKASLNITSYGVLSEYGKEGTRELTMLFMYQNLVGEVSPIVIDAYKEIANVIFYGSKVQKIPNQLYVFRDEKDNTRLKTKYFEGNKLSDEGIRIYSLLTKVGNYEKNTAEAQMVLEQLRKDVFNLSQFEVCTLYEAKLRYKNIVQFWDSATHQDTANLLQCKEITMINDDTDYLYALVGLYLKLFNIVNNFLAKKNKNNLEREDVDDGYTERIDHQKTKRNKREYSGIALDKLLQTTRYSRLLENLELEKKRQQYIFDEIKKDFHNHKEEITGKKRTIELHKIKDNFELELEKVREYTPSKHVIDSRSQLIYAVISDVKVSLNKPKEENENETEEK
ncbi:MAG: hypothetical protein ACK5NA_02570 [Enterococcus sp.]